MIVEYFFCIISHIVYVAPPNQSVGKHFKDTSKFANYRLSNNKLNNILNIDGKQINSEIALKCLIEQKYCHWHRIVKGKVKQILDLHRQTSVANQSI